MMLEILDLGMKLAVILSAPIIAIMFLAEFALAIVSRFAPQVQVFILAMPIKSSLAIGILIFYMPLMMSYAVDQQGLFQTLFDRLFEMMRVARDL